MAEWTIEAVAARFAEAADTGRRLPRVRVQGYFNVWPPFAREAWETYPDDGEDDYRPLPPSPEAVERMLEAMRWVQWLDVEQRHLVWLRARRYRWQDIAVRSACCSRTVQRHWQAALRIIADRLTVARVAIR